jgi:hypothetical protein
MKRFVRLGPEDGDEALREPCFHRSGRRRCERRSKVFVELLRLPRLELRAVHFWFPSSIRTTKNRPRISNALPGTRRAERSTASPAILSTPYSGHGIADQIYDFDPDTGSSQALRETQRAAERLKHILDARGALADACIPEFYPWHFDQEGLTDTTEHTQVAKRYRVFLDMHS